MCVCVCVYDGEIQEMNETIWSEHTIAHLLLCMSGLNSTFLQIIPHYSLPPPVLGPFCRDHRRLEGHKNDEWTLQHLKYEPCFSVHQKMKLSLLHGT